MTIMNHLILIDAYGFLFRAYHALPPLINPQGEPVGAIYGFLNMLLKSLSEHTATHWIAVCDTGKETFRHKIYPEYKANRGKPDDDLIPQFALLKEALSAFNIPALSVEGYEADDVIATIATTADIDVTIISSDKDLMQLINDKVKMFDPMKNRYISIENVIDKFGVGPDQLLDCFALIGDASDNIPGVPGIGPKTAALLIKQFGSLENLLDNLDQIKQQKRRGTLQDNIDKAKLSKKLAKLAIDVDIDNQLDDFIFKIPEQKTLIPFLRKHDFKIIINKAEKLFFNNQNKDSEYKEIKTQHDIALLIKECKSTGEFALYAHFDKELIKVLGVSSGLNNYSISCNQVGSLAEIFTSSEILTISYNIKLLLKYIDISTFDDIDVMAYALSTTKQSLEELSYHYIGEQLAINAPSQAQSILKIHKILKGKLLEKKLVTLYSRLDHPSISVLHLLEKQGVLIDRSILEKASTMFAQKIENVSQDIFNITGHDFNIASTKQLADVMFKEMKIDGGRKLKSGNYSTDNEILTSLATQGIEIATKVLEWRHYSKLKNTYTDSLISHITTNNRIHTTYSMTTTSTGRLSSNNPNLQNIPRNSSSVIRTAFIAPPDHYLISADYSQIELRLLAHIANISEIKQALNDNKDLHTITAEQIFGEVNDELRQKAKAINFGIIYGISPFGLAKQLNISIDEAHAHITTYFQRYPKIAEYIEEMKGYARTHGYVKTIYGRHCHIQDIKSKSIMMKEFAERAAINAPLQGSAADIMKDATVKLSHTLTTGKIILQIHDELIIETPKYSLQETSTQIKSILENVVQLTVPMKVNLSYGDNLSNLTKFTFDKNQFV